ncbi:hypothetical protein O181_015711 [Austropuccinia psidii MF-1]|uniref:Uncharacterized protein n=1 Tax=Austropuccinia psidii MF-1 TaxID=1389203 RepID=A0A9Q3C0E1_9BASI|nr:hypothetical protein [Austropuccinia psidii MF-1]
MSSSKALESHSGSVHYSDSESSIEYVQTQSPLSPNIPLTPPIAYSMNVSDIHIVVANQKAQTSSTWSIPNISITPVPPNPTNTQMHVSEGPGSTPEISSKANPQPKFKCEFLLNTGPNPFPSRITLDKRVDGRQQKTPLENATLSCLLEGNPRLMLQQNTEPKGKSVQSQEPIEDCDELYASSPLVHKEKVTGHHHPYPSIPRMGHASSSREKIVDDEDKNMSPTQSEINDEQRRENFTAHEQGTQSNSEFTHPQIPLSQSMLDQSKIRQQRHKARKAHNVAKRASQKEQQKWLKVELPEYVHGMRLAVHSHYLFLLEVRDKDFSSQPAPPSTEEREIAIQVAGHLGYVPKDVFNEPSTQF